MAEGLMTIGASFGAAGLHKGMDAMMGTGGSGDKNTVGQQIQDQINKMNNSLTKNLNDAINYNNVYNQNAINNQLNYQNQGSNALNTGLNNANQALQNSLFQGFNQSQALQSPYALMGYNAADAYADSLGIARPKMGSANMAQMMNQAATAINPQKIQELQAAAKAAGIDNPFSSQITAPNAVVDPRMNRLQLMEYLSPEQKAAMANDPSVLTPQIQALDLQFRQAAARKDMNAVNSIYNQMNALKAQRSSAAPIIQGAHQSLDAWAAEQQKKYDAANATYQQQVGLQDQFKNAQQSLLGSVSGMTPEQLKTALAYRSGSFNTPTQI